MIAVLGNHDHYASGRAVSAGLARLGYQVLDNANTTVDAGGAPLCVVGVDDPVTRRDRPDAAFAGAGPGTRIALCHDPRRAKAMARRGAALTLSSHTHGGQVNPGGITVRIAQRFAMHYMPKSPC